MIYIDDDSVKIGGILLPGIYKSIEVNHDAKIDEQDVEGSSVRPKQASGYDDAKITIEISLMDSESVTKEEKLQTIQNMFRGAGQEKPQPHEMVSTHSGIRGIKKVLIKNMTSKETNKKDEIVVNLELIQYETMSIRASGGKGKAGSGGADASNLTDAYQGYLASGRGITQTLVKGMPPGEAATGTTSGHVINPVTGLTMGSLGKSMGTAAAAGQAVLAEKGLAPKQQLKTEKSPAADTE